MSDSTTKGPIDADLVARIVAQLMAAMAAAAPDRSAAQPQAAPERVRVSRDYEVLRGLLGQSGAARPLRMKREKGGFQIIDRPPRAATAAEVESDGTGERPVTESVDLTKLAAPGTVTLATITQTMPISRVELFDEVGELVAFGPSLPPL